MNMLYAILLMLLPLALSPLTPTNYLQQDPHSITLHQLLVQHGIQDGQMALVMVAPLNAEQALQANAEVNVHYRSQSAPLNVQHYMFQHQNQGFQLSRSEEEPHRLVHEIVRPVMQEVREIIQPYRRIVQGNSSSTRR
ncbi:hypothetical protein DERP_015375, partial [Dermatophagoides pteronyssinus]